MDDVVDAFLLAGSSDAANGQIFNLGGPPPISLRELVALMIDVYGSGSFVWCRFRMRRKAIDIGSFYADYHAIHSTLGWEPRISLREGLTRTFEYYLKHQDEYWTPDPQ